MTATQIAAVIEKAARAADCCPHAIFTTRKRSPHGNRATIARNVIYRHLVETGQPIERIAKAFGVKPHSVRRHLRVAEVRAKHPVAIAVSAALHPVHL